MVSTNPFRSYIAPDTVVIDDDNFSRFVNGDVAKEYGRGYHPRDFGEHPYGASGKTFEESGLQLIPEDEWKPRIEFMEMGEDGKSPSHLSSLNVPRKNQIQTSLCWSFATIHGEEVYAAACNKTDVPSLSPGSVAGYINGYRDGGGWGTKALKRMVEWGVLPSSIVPDTKYNCRKEVELPANQEIAATYMVREWVDLPSRSWQHLVSALLQRFPVSIGLNWWSHQVLAMRLVIMPSGEIAVEIDNSWGEEWSDNGRGILTRSKATPDDASMPRVAA